MLTIPLLNNVVDNPSPIITNSTTITLAALVAVIGLVISIVQHNRKYKEDIEKDTEVLVSMKVQLEDIKNSLKETKNLIRDTDKKYVLLNEHIDRLKVKHVQLERDVINTERQNKRNLSFIVFGTIATMMSFVAVELNKRNK